ncbi:hypothetical protein LPJ73_007138, partial [Coemansia sp. RSA 2703]
WMRDTRVLPWVAGQDWSCVWTQRFHGDVTVLPRTRVSELPKLLSDPAEPWLARCFDDGARAVRPWVAGLQTRRAVEDAVAHVLADARAADAFAQALHCAVPDLPRVDSGVDHADDHDELDGWSPQRTPPSPMTNSSTQMQTAVVKLALSGDTLVLRGALRGNQAPAERTLTLSHITAPRLASAKRGEPDAPGAYASREFLRRRVAGKRVHFAVRHATANREFGLVELDGVDVAMLLVREGWAQLSTHARARLDRGALRDADEEAEVRALADAEQLARAGRRGLWAPPGAVDARPRVLVFDGDAAAFVRAHAGRELKATVEHVRDAATLRLAVHLPTCHQTLTLQMAGVRAPSTQPGASEPFADEARFQAEAKLLHHDVHVTIAAAAATSGVFVGSVRHPAGNIAEWLVSAGYARVNDATAAHVPGGPQRLRDLERDARDRRVNIWRDHVAPQKP